MRQLTVRTHSIEIICTLFGITLTMQEFPKGWQHTASNGLVAMILQQWKVRVFQCGSVELLFGTRSPDRKKCALVQHPHLLLLLRSKRMGLGGTA